eukprot:g44421.t1
MLTELVGLVANPEVHKPGVPHRSIVSVPGTPTYRLAKELQQKLKYSVANTTHSIHSSQEFFNIIKDTRIEEDEMMRSFIVTALFTSINIDIDKGTIATLLDESSKQAPQDTNTINKDTTMKLLDLCLTSHFTFHNGIYKQINRTPMGTPISGLIAEVVMQ